MKINTVHTSNRIAKRFNRSGMTLIEISLVIALLLGLIAVVFMGIGSYRAGSDRAKCKMQLASIQKAVRAGANFKGLEIGGALVEADVFGAGNMMATAPVCPSDGGVYAYEATVPLIGEAYASCDYTDGGTTHVLAASETTDW